MTKSKQYVIMIIEELCRSRPLTDSGTIGHGNVKPMNGRQFLHHLLLKGFEKIMNFSQIMKFLEQGLSVDEIQQIIDKSAAGADNGTKKDVTKEEPKKADTEKQETTPDWVTALNKNISDLTKTVQANAILNSNISAAQTKTVDERADEILANILNPKE